jgi:hypothetical protein
MPASGICHKLAGNDRKEEVMKRYALWAAAAGVAAALAAPSMAAAPPGSASVLIRHQLRGCHTWSVNGGGYQAELDVRLARGGSVTITNNDPMVHKLIRERGPAVRMTTIPHAHMKTVGLQRITGPGVMNHMGAALRVTFPRAGTYRLTTEDLGDYFEFKTLGHHNHLMLIVRVP